jgi:hypothetical protein
LLDNHRPLHLANVYSRYNVVVLDDGSIGADDLPSDGSDLSSDDDDDSNSDDDEEMSEPEKHVPRVGISSKCSLNDMQDLSDAESEDQFDEDQATKENAGNDQKDEDHVDSDHLEAGDLDSGHLKSEIIADNVFVPEAERDEPPIDGSAGAPDESADEEEVIGKKRKALSQMYDPTKHRKKNLRSYYNRGLLIFLRTLIEAGDSYAAPTAVMLVNLVKNLNKSCTPDILWSAILGQSPIERNDSNSIGVTDQFQRNRITELLYHAICDEIKVASL